MIKRATRVADLLQEEISHIILRELSDPRIGFVTVTGVSVSDDLRHAKVHVSVMGTSEEVERTLQGLQSAKGFIQGCIGRRVKLRYTPELTFRLDTSASYGERIEKMLRNLKGKKVSSSTKDT